MFGKELWYVSAAFTHFRLTMTVVQYDGDATVNAPPQDAMFDWKKSRSSLNYPQKSRAQTAAGPLASLDDEIDTKHPSDLQHFASIVSSMERIANGRRTPVQSNSASALVTPLPNTPTKLSKYLIFAQDNLKIFGATSFEDTFRNNGIGPDILHLVPDDKLTALGVSLGDALRLKAHSLTWLTSQRSHKRKERDEDTNTNNDHIPAAPVWGPNSIRFEQIQKDGSGAMTVYGEIGDGTMSEDSPYQWRYLDDESGEMVPFPPGRVPIVEGVDTGVEDY
jgi:hypothetical protein